MKTVKTTLIVVATLVAVYLIYDLITATSSTYLEASAENEAISDHLDQRMAWEELATKYKEKPVTITSGGQLTAPFWQIYQYNKVGSLQHGDKVTLLELDLYHSEGPNVKVRQKDGSEGYVDIAHIIELNE